MVAEDGGVRIKGLPSADQVLLGQCSAGTGCRASLLRALMNDHEFMREFHGVNTKQADEPGHPHETFREEVLTHPLVMAIADAMFLEESGSYWLTTAQIIQIGPGNPAQGAAHRDLEQFHPFIGMGPAGPEVIINFMIALTDYTDENGATRVIPGSNRWADYEDRGEPEDTVPAVMDAGDVFFFSGKTAHGGGANVTKDQYRRGVDSAFQPGYLVPEEAYPFLIDMELANCCPPALRCSSASVRSTPRAAPGYGRSTTPSSRTTSTSDVDPISDPGRHRFRLDEPSMNLEKEVMANAPLVTGAASGIGAVSQGHWGGAAMLSHLRTSRPQRSGSRRGQDGRGRGADDQCRRGCQ